MRATFLRLLAAGFAAALAWFAPAAMGAPCAGFTDVDDASPFCSNVTWLKNRAITFGCTSATLYCPNDAVIRLAMAAFLNRLGTAFTPVQLRVDQSPGAIDLDATPVVCQTGDFVADEYPRAAYANVSFSGQANADVGIAADLVMSSNAGATWTNLNLFASRGLVRANQWGTLFDLGLAHLSAEQSMRFGVRVGRITGGGDLTASRCALRVLVYNHDERLPALLKVAATIPNASEAGPVHGQFTLTRSGGDLTQPLVVQFALGGSATNCFDYDCIDSIVIPAHQASVQVPVTVLQDTLSESVETVFLNLLPDPGYAIATPSAVATIADGPPPTNAPPSVNAGANQTIALPAGADLLGTVTDDGHPNPPHALTLTWSKQSGPGTVTFNPVNAATSAATFSLPGTYVLRLTANDGALSDFADVTITVNAAPAIDPTVVNEFSGSTAFLYQGPNPIQTGVVAGTITPQRAAVIKGNVRDRTGAPLAGARISILSNPQYGQTFTRADGNYDLAVNGGGKLVVRVEKAGYFEVQRDVIVPWRDFVHAPDVVLTALDPAAVPVDLSLQGMQVARGTTMTDGVGTRRATLIFPPGTSAQFRMPNGSLQPAPSRLTIRQTEYTVGNPGPDAMPAELPPTSGYTYATELTIDEQAVAGAIGVQFNQPVYFYVENFRNFAVGLHTPAGFYDRQAGVWKGEPDGRVIQIIAINGGFAELDTDGNGAIDNGIGTGQNGANLGIGNSERQTLATLYTAGQTLWRVATTHFSPLDINWPYGPPPDAVPPNNDKPKNENDRKAPCDCEPCKSNGSIIECANQTLGESIPIVGTGMSLNYRSDRVPGRFAANTIDIPLTGGTVPASLVAVSLDIQVAGQRSQQRFGASAGQATTYAWDGRDAYGRAVQGQQKARIRVGFEYPAVYQSTPAAFYASWALASGNPTNANGGGSFTKIFRDFELFVGAWDARGQGLGGWSLSDHHVYDFHGRVLYLGSGERRRDVDGLAPIVATIAGNGSAGAPIDGVNATASPMVLFGSKTLVEPDGGVLFISSNNGTRMMRVKPDGTLQRMAGPGAVGAPLFGVPAVNARFADADQFAHGPDGSIYVTYRNRAVIARIRPSDQVVELFAGTVDQPGFTGDGGPATSAGLNQPRDITVGSDGSVFVHDAANQRIRRIGPDGIINTIAGNGATCGGVQPDPQCDDGPALGQKIGNASGDNHLTIAPDGSLYAIRPAGTFGALTELYRIGTDGVLRVIGGDRDINPGVPQSTAEGIPAIQANFNPMFSSTLAVDRDGLVYFGYTHNFSQRSEVRFIDREGKMRILAGSQTGFGGDGGPARSAKFGANPPGLAFGPSGELVIADAVNNRVRRLQSRYPGFSGAADVLLAAEDGGSVYRFDANGRHLQTLHALTGTALLNFGYDVGGRLITITDGDNNVTTIQRNVSGVPTAIMGPFGQTTQLVVDGNGWMTSVTNPANETVALVHQANGLLTTMTTPKGQNYTFAYNAATGFLVNDADPAGGSQALARTDLPPTVTRVLGQDVSKTTALGRTTNYRTERMHNGDRVETATATDGTQTVMAHQPSGGASTTKASGATSSGLAGADPRFGMLAPLTANRSISMPGGNTATFTETENVTLSDPANVFALTTLDTTTTVNGRAFQTFYTAATRLFTETSAAGRISTTTIDALGRPIAEQYAGLAPSSMTYDTRGRLVSMTVGTGAEARTTSYAYDSRSYLQSITDPLNRVTSFTYDNAGRMITGMMPDGRVLTIAYDANGNATAVTPPGRPAHAFSYSAVDLETQYDPPNVAGVTPDVTNTTHNVDRQPTLVTRADGRSTTPTYDSAGRVTSMAFSRGAIGVSYSATTGLVSGMTAPDSVTHAFVYDGTLLTSSTTGGPLPGSVAWAYDNDFRVAIQSVNGGNAVSYAYDADSLMMQAGALVLNRNAQTGLLTGTALGNVTDAWTYNSHSEPTDYQVSVSGSPVYRIQFTRDALGRITQKVETIGGVTDTYAYTYDTASRLIGANRNATPITYTYDTNSNRTATTGPLGTVAGAVYDAQDRLVQYGTTTYTYDNHGDLATRTQSGVTTQYSYDEFGNLVRIVLPGGTQIDYVIDGFNRRIGKKVDGTLIKRWIYDGKLRIVAELDGSGNLVSRFVYGGRINVPEYIVQGPTTYRLVSDHLGSPRLLVNSATGAIAGTMNHDAFGRVTQDTLSMLIPFGYAGGNYDPQTGLVRFGARDYAAEIGRWTSKEPMGFAGNENFYGYAAADPVNFMDPDGLDIMDNMIGLGYHPTKIMLVNRREGQISTLEPGSNQPINVMTNRYMEAGKIRIAPWSTVEIGSLQNGRKILIRTNCDELEVDVADLRHFIYEMNAPWGPPDLPLRKTGRVVSHPPPLKWVSVPLDVQRKSGKPGGWIGRDPNNPSRTINTVPFWIRTSSQVSAARG